VNNRERMQAGLAYDANAPEMFADRARCRVLVERLNATPHADRDERHAILRELLGSFGEDADILAPFQCDYGWQIHIGARTFINYGAIILDCAEVRIGADVQIGPGVQLISALHPLDAETRRSGVETAEPVVIEDGAWLAAGVIVLPGVTVGREAVIGAGSVVTRDMPTGQLCFGNPCRPVRPAADGDDRYSVG
jgi:maltose O-acetyltransferase